MPEHGHLEEGFRADRGMAIWKMGSGQAGHSHLEEGFGKAGAWSRSAAAAGFENRKYLHGQYKRVVH